MGKQVLVGKHGKGKKVHIFVKSIAGSVPLCMVSVYDSESVECEDAKNTELANTENITCKICLKMMK